MKTLNNLFYCILKILKLFGLLFVLIFVKHDLSAQIPDFQVNNNQSIVFSSSECEPEISIATIEKGEFIITWTDIRDGYFDIYAQRFSKDGLAIGDNFKINDSVNYMETGVTSSTGSPSIAANDNGQFVVAWKRWCGLGDRALEIYARCYSSDGTALGSNFKVNVKEGGWSIPPSVAMDNPGNFVITWIEDNDIFAQRYSSDGSPLGTYFKVNSTGGNNSDGNQSIAMDPTGNFIIVWPTNGFPLTIYAQRYSSEGEALGNNFMVNVESGDVVGWIGCASPLDIASDSSGNFVITWASESDDPVDSTNIFIQRFSNDGIALGNNIKVNDNMGWQLYPSVAMDETGNIVVVWLDWDWTQNTDSHIHAQLFTRDGNKFGDNYLVTNMSDSMQWAPSVKLSNGKIYTTWLDKLNEGEGFDVYANIKEVDFPYVDVNDISKLTQPDFILSHNYPNPFSLSTVISYQLPSIADVELRVYNLLGQKITTLVKERQQPGSHEIEWNAESMKPGIYWCELKTAQSRKVMKMILLRE